jgi:hypothetical protein
MATIKFKRGSGTPSGLTAGEPAFDTTNKKLFVHDGTTGIWVGGEVDNSTSLGTSQVKIPTQYAVKTYVDNNLASGAVTSVNGVTGAVIIRAGTGISVAAGTDPDKGITISNIGVQSLTLSATVNGGLAVSGAGTTGALSKDISISFANLPSLGASVATGDLLVVGDVDDSNNTKDTTVGNVLDIINGDVNVDSNGTSSIAAGAIVDADIASNAGITVTKLAAFTISGHTLGNNLSTLTIGNGLGGTSYNGSAPVTITNTGVTGAVAGTGISVSAQTGNVTITNIGVTSLSGTPNEVEVSGSTGAVTVGLPNDVTITNNLIIGGNLTVNGTTTTVNSSTLAVDDPLIQLAKGNSAADSLDIGFYGLYDTAGTDKYTGLFRDATDGKYRLFRDLETAPTTTVNTAGTGYAVATLVANLEGTATTATNVTTTEASGTYYLAMASGVNSSTGLAVDTTATALSYVTTTGILTCTQIEAIVDGGSY